MPLLALHDSAAYVTWNTDVVISIALTVVSSDILLCRFNSNMMYSLLLRGGKIVSGIVEPASVPRRTLSVGAMRSPFWKDSEIVLDGRQKGELITDVCPFNHRYTGHSKIMTNCILYNSGIVRVVESEIVHQDLVREDFSKPRNVVTSHNVNAALIACCMDYVLVLTKTGDLLVMSIGNLMFRKIGEVVINNPTRMWYCVDNALVWSERQLTVLAISEDEEVLPLDTMLGVSVQYAELCDEVVMIYTLSQDVELRSVSGAVIRKWTGPYYFVCPIESTSKNVIWMCETNAREKNVDVLGYDYRRVNRVVSNSHYLVEKDNRSDVITDASKVKVMYSRKK